MGMLNRIHKWRTTLPEGAAQYDDLTRMIITRTEAFRAASGAAVQPVPHKIRIAAAP